MDDGEFIQTRREIGARLRERRKISGLTQQQLSGALGYRSSTRVNQVELGRVRLYADELPRICQELNCSVHDIVAERVSSSECEIGGLLQDLDPVAKEHLLRLVRVFSEGLEPRCRQLQRTN